MVVFQTFAVGIFQIILLTSCLNYSDSQVLSLCTDKNDGHSCLLTCTTSDVNQIIVISKSPTNTALGTCIVGGTCFSADSLLYNVSQIGTNTYLEIISFDKSDNATWRCEYTGNAPHDIFLAWSKLPVSVTELSSLTSNVTITNDLTISIEVGCLYSLQGPQTNLQLMCGGALVTSFGMSCNPSSTVCSDLDLSAYICNYTILSKPPSQTCNSGYTGYSLKVVVSFDDTTRTYAENVFTPYTISFESGHASTQKPTTQPTPDQRCFLGIHYPPYVCVIIITAGIIVVVISVACIICRCISSFRKKSNKYQTPEQKPIYDDSNARNVPKECVIGGDEGISTQNATELNLNSNNETTNSDHKSESSFHHQIHIKPDKSACYENSERGQDDMSNFDAAKDAVTKV